LSLLQREVLPAGLVGTLTGIETGGAADSAITSEDQGCFSAMAAAEVAIYLQATLLPDADTFSMASSVELRVPFVDTRVFAASLAYVKGTARIPGKVAIGALLNDSYIKGLAERRKRGFSVPMRQWMTGPLRPVLRAAEEPDAPVWSVVDRKAAQRTGLLPLIPRDRWADVWAIAALNTWLSTIDY
jgi:asparagine synthase (glutamine-hydrolysing)